MVQITIAIALWCHNSTYTASCTRHLTQCFLNQNVSTIPEDVTLKECLQKVLNDN